MSGFFWKLNRMRAMSLREVPHRAFRWVAQKVESAAIAGGWAPTPAMPVKPRLSLFVPQEDWLATWQAHFALEQAQLDSLLQGKMGFFGHAPLDVGMPVNWHRDPLTGIEAPLSFGKTLNYRDDRLVGNVKVLWELGRHQHLIPLAAAYACTGETRYRDAVVNQIEGWIDTNPYGIGIHWCSALEPALRLISWAVVHSLLALRDGEGGLFSAVADAERLGRAIYQQAWFVRHFLSRYSSANNHLIGELTGLWVTCRVFDLGRQGDRWAETAQRELERESRLQVHGDGVNKEQACYYHLWVLEYFLFAWIVGLRSKRNFSKEFGERIGAMADFLRAITPPDGIPPQIGDADDGFVTRFTLSWPENAYLDVLTAVDAVIEGRAPAVPVPQKVFWYVLCLGELVKPEKRLPVERSYPAFFREGGYAVLGRGSAHVVFDVGPLGYPSIAAHGHADALNVCLAVSGMWWLIDPGTYVYHSEHGWRDYFRGTAAHNTLLMDGLNQSEIGGPFLWLRHAHARLVDAGVDACGGQWAAGEHDGYKRIGGVHARKVELDDAGGQLTITDEVHGNGEHELRIHFHFAPDIELQPDPQGGAWLAIRPGAALNLSVAVDDAWCWDVVRGGVDPKLGWFSSALGDKVPACTLRGVWRGRLPARVVTRVLIH